LLVGVFDLSEDECLDKVNEVFKYKVDDAILLCVIVLLWQFLLGVYECDF
jgi:hypothetical protein